MPAQRKACPQSAFAKGRKFEGLLHRVIQLLHGGKVRTFRPRFWLAFAMVLAAPALVLAQQTSSAAQRITAAVDNSSRVTIPQSKHPLAQPTFDIGPVDGTTPMQRMILVLGVSPEQGHDLTTFLDSQQTQGSPDFHNWITPDQFGQRFGPAPQDIQAVTQWLQQQGFTVGSVARSGRWIEFSGTSAQVEAAFQTRMRHYQVNGEAHVANATNISIPSALAPVVRGVTSLHNFFSKPMHVQGAFVRRTTNGTYAPLSGETNLSGGHAVSPADFARIYDVPNSLLSPAPGTVLNGTGETIAIVARTDINPQDVADFRTVSGLPALTSSNPNFIINGEDPGIFSADDQVETTLDTEWSGAVAPAATIDVVISQPTLIEDGVDLSAIYIVDHNLAPIMSVSFGACEAAFGSGAGSESEFINSLWQQAAAQGISVFVSSGDDGAAGCDANGPALPPGASGGVGVSALSSPWYDTAVGGTEFNESITATNFWNAVTLTDLQSVIGYIPEKVWNDSCSTGCDGGLDSLEAGGGGVSLLYTTPPYQTLNVSGLQATLSPFSVSGVTPRAVPDISLAASADHDGYLLCLNLSCEPTANPGFYQVGGTSVSSPAFAGIMALVEQKLANKPQGLANYVLYPLAAAETYSGCNSSSRTNPATPTGCVFNDNTVGTNGVPGNDVTNDPASGALGYPTGTGYDLASGLGSVDAINLINAWSTASATFFGTQTTITSPASISITHGASVAITGTTARLSTDSTTLTPTGTLALLAQGGPFASPVGVGSTTLSGSGGTATTSGNIGDLPGGSYTLFANYPGDGTFAGSASTPINVTVAKEAPGVVLIDSPAGSGTFNTTPITVYYGTPIVFEALISGLSSVINQTGDGAATGTVTFTRTLGSTTTNLSPAIPLTNFAQEDSGLGEFYDCSGTPSTCPTPGVNTINGSYSGDNSFTAGNSGTSNPSFSLSVTIVSAATSTTVSSPASGTTVGTTTPVTLNAAVATSSGSGNAPTGTFTFFSGATQLASPVAVTGTAGNQTFAGAGTSASAVASLTTALPSGTDSITAIYNGDSNYAASPASAPITITAVSLPATTTTLSANPSPGTVGQNVTFTATVTSTQMSPAITGTVTFSVTGTTLGSAPVSGGQAILSIGTPLLGTFTITAAYSGDTNYNGSSGTTNFTVNEPAPTLTGISPTSGALGQAVPSFVLTGSGFVAGSTVNFGSHPITGGTVGSGGTTLMVAVPAGDVATAGPVSVTVTNAAPGGGTSGPQTFTVNNPQPTITQLSPTSATAGGTAFTLTITGTNFVAGASVNFGTFSGLVPTSITAGQIVVQIPATDIVTAGNINVVVTNPAPGGGASSGSPFTINNPLPSITTLSPTSATAGGTAFSLTISGTKFAAGATVNFGTFTGLVPTSITTGQIVVQVPATDIVTAANINVVVVNSAPGGGTSIGSPFTINNPLPSISTLSPTSATAGGAAFTLTIAGTGFAPGATVSFGTFSGLVPTSITAGQIVVQIPATDITTGGNVNVTVTNVSPGGGTSTAKVFPVNNAIPTISGLSPTGVTVNSGTFSLTITGTGFAAGATVSFGTFTGLVPTSITPGQIVMQIPAGDIGTVGSFNVVVINSTPGGGPSTGFSFSIASAPNPSPTLTSISPTSGTTGQSVNLTLTGTNFIAGSIVNFGANQDSGASVGNGGNTLTITIPASQLSTAGPVSVSAMNPAPGGGTSLAQTFTVNNPFPTLTAISPTSGPLGQAVPSFVLTGTGFLVSSTVKFGSNNITGGTVGSGGTTLTVSVPAVDLATAGPVSVVVTNAAPGGGTSGPETFTVDNSTPAITLLSPASATAGGTAFTLAITGTNFVPRATVSFGTFTGLVPASITATTITVQIPAADIATGGTSNVSVTNPAPGGGASGTLPFTINNPLPTVTSLSPTNALAGGATFQLTITGTGFVSGVSSVTFGSNAPIIPPPASVTPTQIQVQIPATYIASAANINVTVTNPAPNGGTSATSANSAFAVKNPAPTLTSVSPASGTVGLAVSSFVLTGSGFISGSTVNFGSHPITGGTVGGGGTTLTVAVPASDVATLGPVSVTVTNATPGGGTSGPQTFAVNNPLPTITSLSQTSVNAGGAAFALTITGTNFVTGATVTFGSFGPLTPTSLNATQIAVTIPAPDIATVASINVTVTNPAPGGGISNAESFTIDSVMPTLTSLSPASTTAGGSAFALTINGSGFLPGATVNFGSMTGLVPTSVTAGQVVVQIPATDIATITTVNVSVMNPAPTTGVSNSEPFAINNPVPTIASVSPTHAPGGAGFTMTITGTGFVTGATVALGSNPALTPTTISPTQIVVSVPAADMTSAGTPKVSVTNPAPGGGASAQQLTFTVDDFTATISANPATITAGQSTTISVTVVPTDANGFGNAVNFTVSGLPGDSTISPNPIPSVTPGNNPVTFMLTLNTTARSALPTPPGRPGQPLGIQIILWSMTVALAMMALAALSRGHKTHRWATALPSAVLFAGLAVVSGCTSKANTEVTGTGTPAGPSQISVTANSGTLGHTSPTVTIMVN